MKKLLVLCMAAAFTAAMAFGTYAADTGITSLAVSFVEDREDPGTVNSVQVNVSDSNVSVEEANPSRDYEDWRPGVTITYNIVLTPEEGYRFNTGKLKNITVQNGELVNKTIRSTKITMKVNYRPKVTLAKPENIYFEDDNKAQWDAVQYCDMYEVEILKQNDDGNFVSYKTVQQTQRKIDLSDYVTDGADTYFRVRAIPKSANQAIYLKSSEWSDSNDLTAPSDNTVNGNFNGVGNDRTFTDVSGVNAVGWQKINNSWYYFDPRNHNKAVTSNWSLINDKWYYFNEYSMMQTGWITLNGLWYYLNGDGAMVTGWFKTGPSDPWYYLDPASGALWVSTVTPDGYRVDASGAWVQ